MVGSRYLVHCVPALFSPFICFLLLVIFFVMLGMQSVSADSRTPGKVISGWVEKISVGNSSVMKAKLDTGAATSSIHAENIRTIRKDRETWVSFDIKFEDVKGGSQQHSFELPRVRKVRIKNHDGDHDSRPVVVLQFCFDGRWHETEFTLADRSEFIYPVLLGRQFLQDVAVIDPSETFLTFAHCKGV